MAQTTVTSQPLIEPVAAIKPAQSWLKRYRWVLLFVGLIIVFAGTYGLAWWNAYRLTNDYLEDADASFEAGNYLEALTGYEKYDTKEQKYVEYGGYMQIQRIWENDYSYPVPDGVQRAKDRVHEIVYERLTIEDAEQFVLENIGRTNPYLGMIYLRWGELYEANGELRDAEDIYESIPDEFPNDKALQAQAAEDLANLRRNILKNESFVGA